MLIAQGVEFIFGDSIASLREESAGIDVNGSVTIVDKLLILENTSQMYNEPGKVAMLSAYNNKTDIILGFKKCVSAIDTIPIMHPCSDWEAPKQ